MICFFEALAESRLRRGIYDPQWWMLPVAILIILSNQGLMLEPCFGLHHLCEVLRVGPAAGAYPLGEHRLSA